MVDRREDALAQHVRLLLGGDDLLLAHALERVDRVDRRVQHELDAAEGADAEDAAQLEVVAELACHNSWSSSSGSSSEGDHSSPGVVVGSSLASAGVDMVSNTFGFFGGGSFFLFFALMPSLRGIELCSACADHEPQVRA